MRSHAYLTDLVERQGIPVFDSIDTALQCTAKLVKAVNLLVLLAAADKSALIVLVLLVAAVVSALVVLVLSAVAVVCQLWLYLLCFYAVEQARE